MFVHIKSLYQRNEGSIIELLFSNNNYCIIINNSPLIFCQQQGQRIYSELITEPILLGPKENRIFNHSDLPSVKDELSITLKINIASNNPSSYATIFHKGIQHMTTNYLSRKFLWLCEMKKPFYI